MAFQAQQLMMMMMMMMMMVMMTLACYEGSDPADKQIINNLQKDSLGPR